MVFNNCFLNTGAEHNILAKSLEFISYFIRENNIYTTMVEFVTQWVPPLHNPDTKVPSSKVGERGIKSETSSLLLLLHATPVGMVSSQRKGKEGREEEKNVGLALLSFFRKCSGGRTHPPPFFLLLPHKPTLAVYPGTYFTSLFSFFFAFSGKIWKEKGGGHSPQRGEDHIFAFLLVFASSYSFFFLSWPFMGKGRRFEDRQLSHTEKGPP